MAMIAPQYPIRYNVLRHAERGDRHLTGAFGFTADEVEAVRLSLRVAFWAMLGSLPFGLLAAMLLARGRFWGKGLVDGFVHLPLVMPPVVTGYLLLLLFGRQGPLGRFFAHTFGIVFAFRWTGAALASADHGFPAHGPGDPPVARGGRPPPRGGGANARGSARLCLPADHPAADRAGARSPAW